MLDNLVIGQYFPAKSYIHSLDVRAKLIGIFCYVLAAFLAKDLLSYLILGILLFGAVYFSKVPIKRLAKGFIPIIIFIMFTFIVNVFFTKQGELLYNFWIFEFYSGSIVRSLFVAVRIVLIVIMTSLLTQTSTPMEITDGLAYLFAPLKLLKVPVYEISLMLSIALRFIPTLMLEIKQIMKAQQSRGAEFSSGPVMVRMKAVVSLLVPLLVSSFRRADELAIAMEARGYRSGVARTKYRELKMKKRDYVILLCSGAILVIVFWLRK